MDSRRSLSWLPVILPKRNRHSRDPHAEAACDTEVRGGCWLTSRAVAILRRTPRERGSLLEGLLFSGLEVAIMPQCSTCGSTVSDQDKVCPDCGMELGAVPPSAGAQSPAATPPATPAPVPPASSQPPAVPPALPAPPAQVVAGLAKLTLRRAGALTTECFPLGEHVTIGRFDAETGPVDVDMGPLPEGVYLSRHHAEIWRDGSGKWFIKDLGAQNGTFVRPDKSTKFQRVTQDQAISDGDEIAFGNARFEFRTA